MGGSGSRYCRNVKNKLRVEKAMAAIQSVFIFFGVAAVSFLDIQ